MNILKSISVICVLMACAVSMFSQNVIPLYEDGKVPDALATLDEEHTPNLTVFLAENPTGEAVIICPGGGYSGLAINHEGYDIARRFNESGIAGFVLKYRLPDSLRSARPHLSPIQDLQTAIDLVRFRAKEFNVSPNKIGIMGFSAGGHLASTGTTHFDKGYIKPKSGSVRPDFSILIYPVISMDPTFTHGGSRVKLLGKDPKPELQEAFSNEKQITKETPPVFLVHSADDGVVPVKNSLTFAESLAEKHVLFEMHIFPQGGHGYGMNNQTTATEWFPMCVNWIKQKQ